MILFFVPQYMYMGMFSGALQTHLCTYNDGVLTLASHPSERQNRIVAWKDSQATDNIPLFVTRSLEFFFL